MIVLLRLVAGLVALLLLAVIAVGGLVVALFCLRGEDATLSPSHLAELLSLDDFRETLGSWLATLEADGPVAAVAALCGAGAVLVGLGLIVGALVPRRERLLVISREGRGTIAARRRAASAALASLAERPRDVLKAKARIKPKRSGAGGRAQLRLVTARRNDERPAAEQARAELESLAEAMSLRLARRESSPRRGGRVL